MTAPLTFASLRIEKEYDQLLLKQPLLKLMLDEFADHALEQYGWLICVTSIFRTAEEREEIDRKSVQMARPKGSTSPHEVWQAADLRIRGVGQDIVDAMVKWSNARWVYDPANKQRQVADARPHGVGPHCHIQMKPGVTISGVR